MRLLKSFFVCALLLFCMDNLKSQTSCELKISSCKLREHKYIPTKIIIDNKSDSIKTLFYEEIIGIAPTGYLNDKWYGWGAGIYQNDTLFRFDDEFHYVNRDKYFFVTKYGIFHFNLKDYTFYNKYIHVKPHSRTKIKCLINIGEIASKNLRRETNYLIRVIYNTDDLLNKYPKLSNKDFTKGLYLKGEFNFKIKE